MSLLWADGYQFQIEGAPLFMKTPHILLFTSYLCFLLGMVIGASLAHNPVLWIVTIIIITIAIGFMGAIQPRKKKLPTRRNVRLVK